MKMKATVICAGAAAISILLASTCLEYPFQVKADELTNIIDQAYVSTGGAVTPEQTQVTSTPNQTTTVTFKKNNNTVPYSWYKNITATAVSKNGKSVDVTYKSSNKNVATVDKNGRVKGLQEGTVTITATAKDGSKAKATCKVTVEK